MTTDPGDVTRLLERLGADDDSASEELWALVYHQLQRLARRAMDDERGDHTLQATALVHEAWLKLGGADGLSLSGRAPFFATAARAMRRILVDHARTRGRRKRGGDRRRVDVDADSCDGLDASLSPEEVVELDDGLRALAEHDPALAHLVELRFFAGLTIRETADVLATSTASVERQWRLARAFLRRRLDAAADA